MNVLEVSQAESDYVGRRFSVSSVWFKPDFRVAGVMEMVFQFEPWLLLPEGMPELEVDMGGWSQRFESGRLEDGDEAGVVRDWLAANPVSGVFVGVNVETTLHYHESVYLVDSVDPAGIVNVRDGEGVEDYEVFGFNPFPSLEEAEWAVRRAATNLNWAKDVTEWLDDEFGPDTFPGVISENGSGWCVVSSDRVGYLNADGLLHRDNDPAVVYASGTEEWWQNGEKHRVDGPAKVWADGSEEWWQNGEKHRVDGPAVVYADGSEEWWQNGALHRDGGPAVTRPAESREVRTRRWPVEEWWQHGKEHRVDGPAKVWADGRVEWWLEGRRVSAPIPPSDALSTPPVVTGIAVAGNSPGLGLGLG